MHTLCEVSTVRCGSDREDDGCEKFKEVVLMHTFYEVSTVRYGSDREDDGCEQLEEVESA